MTAVTDEQIERGAAAIKELWEKNPTGPMTPMAMSRAVIEAVTPSGPTAWLCTERASGRRDLRFEPLADLPFNHKNWTWVPLYLLATPQDSAALREALEQRIIERIKNDGPRLDRGDHTEVGEWNEAALIAMIKHEFRAAFAAAAIPAEPVADEIVQQCADFAKQVILSDRLPTDEKPRNHGELAMLVYNSLVEIKSKPNRFARKLYAAPRSDDLRDARKGSVACEHCGGSGLADTGGAK